VGPINPPTKRTGERYIITMIEYLTIWVESAPVKDCRAETTSHFLFEQVITEIWMPKNYNERPRHALHKQYHPHNE
jgi:hypothetical protein